MRREPDAVAEAVARYTARYQEPRPNPDRVAIEITVDASSDAPDGQAGSRSSSRLRSGSTGSIGHQASTSGSGRPGHGRSLGEQERQERADHDEAGREQERRAHGLGDAGGQRVAQRGGVGGPHAVRHRERRTLRVHARHRGVAKRRRKAASFTASIVR